MRKSVAVFALVFFFAPAALWVGGVRAKPFENRAMPKRPTLSQRWNAFDGATRFFVARLPLREQAVKANTWTSETVFGTTPVYGRGTAAGGNKSRDALPFGEPEQAPQPAQTTESAVLKGRDGWLFLEAELAHACTPFIGWDEGIKRYDRLLQILRDSGRKVVFAIPPDKSTIYGEYLPKTGFAEELCFAKGREATWTVLEGAGAPPEFLPLRTTMLAGKAAPPEETYYPNDTHWNSKGAVQAARVVLDRLGAPPLLDSDLEQGRAKHVGDLTSLTGVPSGHDSPAWTIKRPGQAAPAVTTEKLGRFNVLRTVRHDVDPPVLPGRTLFLQDSFGDALAPVLEPYMQEFASVNWIDTPPMLLIAQIRAAQTLVLETVERDMTFLVSDKSIVTPAFLDALDAAL